MPSTAPNTTCGAATSPALSPMSAGQLDVPARCPTAIRAGLARGECIDTIEKRIQRAEAAGLPFTPLWWQTVGLSTEAMPPLTCSRPHSGAGGYAALAESLNSAGYGRRPFRRILAELRGLAPSRSSPARRIPDSRNRDVGSAAPRYVRSARPPSARIPVAVRPEPLERRRPRTCVERPRRGLPRRCDARSWSHAFCGTNRIVDEERTSSSP